MFSVEFSIHVMKHVQHFSSLYMLVCFESCSTYHASVDGVGDVPEHLGVLVPQRHEDVHPSRCLPQAGDARPAGNAPAGSRRAARRTPSPAGAAPGSGGPKW